MVRSFFLLILFLTLIKVVSLFSTNFTLFGDEAQYWLWSKTLDIGYLSKPPMIAWALAGYTFFFGDSFVSLKLFPIIFYFLTSIAVYNLAKGLGLNKSYSLICSLTFLVIPAVSFSSFLISTDVLLLFFWTMSMLILINIRNNPSSFNFIILGIFLGLAFLSKYAAIYFLISLGVFVFFDKLLRKILFKNKLKFLYFFITVIIILFPNIVWNLNNGWLTLGHTSNNVNFQNINVSFLRGVEFLFIQILMIGPVLFFGWVLSIKKTAFDYQNVFLLSFSIPIFLIVLVESIVVRANANWAAVALISFFVFLLRSLVCAKNFIVFFNFITNFIFGVFLFLLISFSSNYKVFNRISGIKEFSKEIKNNINGLSNIVVTDRLLYSNLSYELREEGLNFFMPLSPDEKITKHFQINSSLNKNMNIGFLFLGNLSDISYLTNIPKTNLIKEYRPVFLSSTVKVYEVTY